MGPVSLPLHSQTNLSVIRWKSPALLPLSELDTVGKRGTPVKRVKWLGQGAGRISMFEHPALLGTRPKHHPGRLAKCLSKHFPLPAGEGRGEGLELLFHPPNIGREPLT